MTGRWHLRATAVGNVLTCELLPGYPRSAERSPGMQ